MYVEVRVDGLVLTETVVTIVFWGKELLLTALALAEYPHSLEHVFTLSEVCVKGLLGRVRFPARNARLVDTRLFHLAPSLVRSAMNCLLYAMIRSVGEELDRPRRWSGSLDVGR